MHIQVQMRYIPVLLLLITTNAVFAQNRVTAQQIISDLCSEEMAGRGYINQGDKKAAEYIAAKFSALGLKTKTPNFMQPFSLGVNTITKTTLKLDTKELVPGLDYLVSPESGSVKLSGPTIYVSQRLLKSPKVAKKVKRAIKKGYVPVIGVYDAKDKITAKNIAKIRQYAGTETLVFLKENLTWSVGRMRTRNGEIWLLNSSFERMTKMMTIEIESEFIYDYTTQNVYGYVEGTTYPDSIIIFCGHYDHLGKMGDATFYGANDNASGIGMLIDMAAYFAQNPQKYTVVFIAFGAEEAGLAGSLHYVNNPIVPLSQTKFVFNMDLMGSGEGGATIVNATVYPRAFKRFVAINTQNTYLSKIKPRGKAANSDHYFFSEKGVPSFFIYLMGDYKHYHMPADSPKNLRLGEYYDKSFLLIRDFIMSFSTG